MPEVVEEVIIKKQTKETLLHGSSIVSFSVCTTDKVNTFIFCSPMLILYEIQYFERLNCYRVFSFSIKRLIIAILTCYMRIFFFEYNWASF